MRIYLDHNGTSPMLPEVRERLFELLDEGLGNASSTHASGRRARSVVDEARAQIAGCLGVAEEWVLFTAGGTESNNLALRGVMDRSPQPAALAISTIEHSSVLEPARELGEQGHELTLLPVDERGKLCLNALGSHLEHKPCRLLSIMVANNEVGALAPMEQISDLLAERGSARPLWHSDAVQALGKLPLNLARWGPDLVSFSPHKVGGPQGVGILLKRPGVELRSFSTGGGQELGIRAGTENAPAIGAAALAVQLACDLQTTHARRMRDLSTALWQGLQGLTPNLQLVGPAIDETERLPNTVNLLFEGLDGRTLVARLDLEGVEVSQGSACSSGAIEASHVLRAMGYGEREARSALRLSLGTCTTLEDIHSTVEIMGKVLREIT